MFFVPGASDPVEKEKSAVSKQLTNSVVSVWSQSGHREIWRRSRSLDEDDSLVLSLYERASVSLDPKGVDKRVLNGLDLVHGCARD